ncbi:STAS domain-containing protein [Streptomyces sp. JW3]|uniref:STAS domain-containing protein n=1 Tax=Streptomyces sp. JW3 TaxID=3456955 RepID=UPI003FA458DC
MGTQGEASSAAAGAAPGLTVCPLPGRDGVRAAGEIMLTTRGTWQRALEQAVGEGGDVHVEMSGVTFVDVDGAHTLADLAGRLPQGRRLVLHRPPATLRRVLEMFWPDQPAIEVSMS